MIELDTGVQHGGFQTYWDYQDSRVPRRTKRAVFYSYTVRIWQTDVDYWLRSGEEIPEFFHGAIREYLNTNFRAKLRKNKWIKERAKSAL